MGSSSLPPKSSDPNFHWFVVVYIFFKKIYVNIRILMVMLVSPLHASDPDRPLDIPRFGPCRRPPCGPRSNGWLVEDFWGYTVLFSNEVRKQYSELHMTLNGDLGKWSLREVVT